MTGVAPQWAVRHLDLRHAPAELRTNPTRLVGSLLNVDTSTPQEPLLDDDLRRIAAQLSDRQGALLFVLDSAELLTPTCATLARSALTAVRRLVRRTGRGRRMGLVIGTRRHAEWRGLGSDARLGERFEALRLTEFGHEIVHQALLDLSLHFGEEELWSHSAALHRLSEGLPALLVKSVRCGGDFRRDRPLRRPLTQLPHLQDDLPGGGTAGRHAPPHLRRQVGAAGVGRS